MGLFYRKTKKLGSGLNLTLSKRGLGVSAGPRGWKISSRGRLSVSRGGFRFVRKIL